jgi:hypothetical protein
MTAVEGIERRHGFLVYSNRRETPPGEKAG